MIVGIVTRAVFLGGPHQRDDPVGEDGLISSRSRVTDGWGPVPGPVDRVSFFEEQARHRRATWRLAALCGLAVVALGIVVSVVVLPLLFLQLMIFVGILGLVLPIPAALDRAHEGYFEVIGGIGAGPGEPLPFLAG